MKKLVSMVLALAVLAVFLFGCGGKGICPTCGVETQNTEEMQRYNREAGGGGS